MSLMGWCYRIGVTIRLSFGLLLEETADWLAGGVRADLFDNDLFDLPGKSVWRYLDSANMTGFGDGIGSRRNLRRDDGFEHHGDQLVGFAGLNA
jgi:hypothetical protein